MTLTVNFRQVPVDLGDIPLKSPTSMQFGPDGRLYVSQQNGLIHIFRLQPIKDNEGNITEFVIIDPSKNETIDLVQKIPNHDDNGNLNTTLSERQVTGLVIEEGTNGEIVIYVSSSDPRIGGGDSSTAEDELDTNSGIISRLTSNSDGTWDKIDLVIGLPRSEANHSINGLEIRTEIVNGEPHQIMYVASGGNTNKGAPSNNFVWTPEYYYSAAILSVDLTQLEQIEAQLLANRGLNGGTDYVDPYVYALPTLDDPTRINNSLGQDKAEGAIRLADAKAADTFGGNDGRNQAIYDPGGPVQIYSMGYRNSYDVLITNNGNMYTFDNGPNNGWGDVPLTGEGIPVTTSSQIASNSPNINVDTGSDKEQDNLHLITKGFYGGHPNPVYASGASSGLYSVDSSSGSPIVTQLTDLNDPSNDPLTNTDDLPSNWNSIAGGITNPDAGVYIAPGDNPNGDNKGADGSLLTIDSSSNGLTEYREGKVDGRNPLTDNPNAEIVLVASFNGNITFMEIVSDGTQNGTTVIDTETIKVNGTPLDLTSGMGRFADSIFISQFGTDSLIALVPGTPEPPDTDQDDDSLEDNVDPLQYDADNGVNTLLNAGNSLFWDFNPADNGVHPGPSGEYNIGMTGWMINDTDYLDDLTDLDNTIRGGAPGIIQIKSVGVGDLAGTENNQKDAIQTGFLPAANVEKFTIKVPIFNPLSSDANNGVTFSESASMGFSLGDGSMSNWIRIAFHASNPSGSPVAPQVKVTQEENDITIAEHKIDTPDLLNAVDDDQIEFLLTVDMTTLEVTPRWRYQINGVWSKVVQISDPVQLDDNSPIALALRGQNLINGIQIAPVVTLTSTSKGSQPFTADFLDLTITASRTSRLKTVEATQLSKGDDSIFYNELAIDADENSFATDVDSSDIRLVNYDLDDHHNSIMQFGSSDLDYFHGLTANNNHNLNLTGTTEGLVVGIN